MLDEIVITVLGAIKSHDCHQEEAFVKKVLGNPDTILVLEPDNGLVFRQGGLKMEGGEVKNQRTQKLTGRRPMLRPPLQIYLSFGLDCRRHFFFPAKVRPHDITLISKLIYLRRVV